MHSHTSVSPARVLQLCTCSMHSHTSVSPARVLQLCFKKLLRYEIKLAISAAFEVVKIRVALSILNDSGASPGATKKEAALVVAALVNALLAKPHNTNQQTETRE